MAKEARRISKTILILIALLVVAMLIEPLFFPRQNHVLAWTPWGEPPPDAWASPDFPVSKTDAVPLLVLESAPMDWREIQRRQRLLHTKLAAAKLGPLQLRCLTIPQASLAQKAIHLAKLPERCRVVLEISLLDLIREDRGSWGGDRLPLLTEVEGRVQSGGPQVPRAGSDPPAPIMRLPWLRRLGKQPVQETHQGSFPDALWPLRRNGAPDESARYSRLAMALRFWKQLIQDKKGALVVVYLPQPIECLPKTLAEELMALGLDSRQLQSSRAGRHLRDLCQQLAIPFVDPTQLLRGAAKKKRPLYEDVAAAPFEARYTERAENLILGRIVQQGVRPLFK